MPRPNRNMRHTPVYLPAGDVERLERVAGALELPARSDAHRLALARGLDALEADLSHDWQAGPGNVDARDGCRRCLAVRGLGVGLAPCPTLLEVER